MSSVSKQIVLQASEWNTASNRYMTPKVNKQGGKSISLISKQTNRTLTISTPLLMTWGISDFVNEHGESDGKFSISLNFPNDEYSTPNTQSFLAKLKDFENQLLDDAVTNSELWWGESMSRDIVKHTFFPFLKYSKNKDTKKFDYTKPPSIRAKVPYFNDKWNIEIYDTKSEMIFPSEHSTLSPVDLIPKMSSVACVLQCGGIWIGGKGWGLTWKLVQCIVKPKVIVSIAGKCQINLSEEEKDVIEKQDLDEDVEKEEVHTTVETSTVVDNSDDEDETPPRRVPSPVPVVIAPVATSVPSSSQENDASVTVSKKKVVKRKP